MFINNQGGQRKLTWLTRGKNAYTHREVALGILPRRSLNLW
jgi:hypothetical protein